MAPRPAQTQREEARLAALADLELLDTPAEPALDELVALAARLLDAPVALVNLVDADRQWAKAAHGLPHGAEQPLGASFCAHAVAADAPLVVPDALQDPRFAGSPLVEQGLRFYAGVPLRTAGDQPIGTLCVSDDRPRELTAAQLETLSVLARAVGAHVQLGRENRRLADLSATDALTGVANRRAFDVELAREAERARRTRLPLSLLLVDLDHPTGVDDEHGHPAGDALLRAAARRWAGELRGTDLLARVGGEEFAVLLPATGLRGALGVAERLRAGMPGGATCSVGVAELELDEPCEHLVERADLALHAARRGGRDCVRSAGVPVGA